MIRDHPRIPCCLLAGWEHLKREWGAHLTSRQKDKEAVAWGCIERNAELKRALFPTEHLDEVTSKVELIQRPRESKVCTDQGETLSRRDRTRPRSLERRLAVHDAEHRPIDTELHDHQRVGGGQPGLVQLGRGVPLPRQQPTTA